MTARITTFLVLLLYFFVFFGELWVSFALGSLYICTDPFGLGLDLIPPLVHGTEMGDKYLVTPGIVYGIWILVVIAIFACATVATRRLYKSRHPLRLTLGIFLCLLISVFANFLGYLLLVDNFATLRRWSSLNLVVNCLALVVFLVPLLLLFFSRGNNIANKGSAESNI